MDIEEKYARILRELLVKLGTSEPFSSTEFCSLRRVHPDFVAACRRLGFIENQGTKLKPLYKVCITPESIVTVTGTQIATEMKLISTNRTKVKFSTPKVENTKQKSSELSDSAKKAIEILKAEGYKVTLVKKVQISYSF